MEGREAGQAAAQKVKRDLEIMRSVIGGFKNGNPDLSVARLSSPAERAALARVIERFEASATQLETVLGEASVIYEARKAADDLRQVFFRMMEKQSDLIDAI